MERNRLRCKNKNRKAERRTSSHTNQRVSVIPCDELVENTGERGQLGTLEVAAPLLLDRQPDSRAPGAAAQKPAASLYSVESCEKKSSSCHCRVSKVGRFMGSLCQHCSMMS